MVYRGTPTDGDLSDIGIAMQQLLQQVRDRLDQAGHPQVVFEFRQPYVSPAIARYGQILRANDCPGDAVTNRRSVIDARLLSVGQTVHSDPMMWGVHGGADAVAQQLYAGWFSVPQISMRLTELPGEQAAALRGLLQLWRDHREVILDGVLHTQGAENNHLLVCAVHGGKNQSVAVAYTPSLVHVTHAGRPPAEMLIVNATASDRLLLRTTDKITGGVVRSATGQVIADLDPRDAGLHELPVPAYGSLTLTTQTV